MAIDTEVNTADGIILRTGIGVVDINEIKNAFFDSLHHPDFKKEMNAIWDFSQADVSAISTQEILHLIKYLQQNINKRGADFKMAIVASEDLSFGLAKMFQGLGMELPIAIRVVRSRDEAFEWLR